MRKIIGFSIFLLLLEQLFCLEYGNNPNNEISENYWSAVINNDIKMTDEEYIKNYTLVLPFTTKIYFGVLEKIDDINYGVFTLEDLDNVFKGKTSTLSPSSLGPAVTVSEKRITNGLYDDKYPMIKEEKNFENLKYVWHPAANAFYCVWIKFSVGDYKSKWISLGGIPDLKNTKSVYRSGVKNSFQAQLTNISGEYFKIEGIRIIYNCDYKLIIDNLHEAYYLVNDENEKATNLISGGAKYIELKDSSLNKVIYTWEDKSEKYDFEKNSIIINSYDKLNFEDNATKQASNENKQLEKFNLLEAKIVEAAQLLEEDSRQQYEAKNSSMGIERSYFENILKEIEEIENDGEKEYLKQELNQLIVRYDEMNQILGKSFPKKRKQKK